MNLYQSNVFKDPKALKAAEDLYNQIKMKRSQETLDLLEQLKPDKYSVIDTIDLIIYKLQNKKFEDAYNETNGWALIELFSMYLAEMH